MKAYNKSGENIFAKAQKVPSELLTLTYGVFVSKLIRDNQHNVDEVNSKLDKMGFNMGTRMVDEFFAKSAPGRQVCKSFRETVEVIAKEAFKMFLGTTCDVASVPPEEDSGLEQWALILKENPLADFVVLPPQYQNTLWYSNLLCGIIRGGLDMLNMKVNCFFT